MAWRRAGALVWLLGFGLALACAIALIEIRATLLRASLGAIARSIEQHGLYVTRIVSDGKDIREEILRFYAHFAHDAMFEKSHGGFLTIRREGDRLIPVAATVQVEHLLSPEGLAALEPELLARASQPTSTWVTRDYRGVELMVAQRSLQGTPFVVVQVLERAQIEGPLLVSLGVGTASVCLMLGLLLWSLWHARLGLADSQRALEHEMAHRWKLLDQMRSIVISLDPDGRVTDWNQGATRVLGMRRVDALGRTLGELPIHWDAEAMRAGLERARLAPAPIELDTISVASEDGSTRQLGITVSMMPGLEGSETMWLMVGADITARLRAETDMRHSQKMRGIGQLAAGLAHEINTPAQFVADNLRFAREEIGKLLDLTVARGSALEAAGCPSPSAGLDLDYLRRELPVALDQSLEGISRVAEIVRAMRSLAHTDEAAKRAVDLHQVLETAFTVSRSEWKALASIERSYAADLPEVSGVKADLIQVVLSIVMNACHAIADVKREKGVIRVSTSTSGGWVELRISDNGTGMSEAVRSRVFEPFFTTKDVGRGSGQGLSVAYDVVVNKHAGSIQLESEVDVGTTFIVRLPAAA